MGQNLIHKSKNTFTRLSLAKGLPKRRAQFSFEILPQLANNLINLAIGQRLCVVLNDETDGV